MTVPAWSGRDSVAVLGLRSETASERKMRKFLRDLVETQVASAHHLGRVGRCPS